MATCKISVLIPTKNEEQNLQRCLSPLVGWADEVVIVDSFSEDNTKAIAERNNVTIINFDYQGGWPKKRQWALDTFLFRNDWILLLDSDEILSEDVKKEIEVAIDSNDFNGYRLTFQIFFLGRQLRYGGTELVKLSLFRKGTGRYERRVDSQDKSMADMEVHEHVVVTGRVSEISSPVRHENINLLDRYIEKHNEYSNWEAALYFDKNETEIKGRLFGDQAERRRYLKDRFLMFPFSSVAMFLYSYVYRGGFLDGRQGLMYAVFRGIYVFHIKAKIYERKTRRDV